jgi:hypothetical protein
MHLLALDPSTKMGVARWRQGEFWSGVEHLRGHEAGTRLCAARRFLVDKIEWAESIGAPITKVYAEDFHAGGWVHGSNSTSVEFLTMLKGTILEACAATRTPVELVMPVKWRKTFLGMTKIRGGRNAWKQAALDQCRRMGLNPQDDNEAEAIGIAVHARCIHDPRFAVLSTRLFERRAA